MRQPSTQATPGLDVAEGKAVKTSTRDATMVKTIDLLTESGSRISKNSEALRRTFRYRKGM